ncbi:tail fiber assembly protein [Orbaceae bacterium ESL0727]|nr:tail fiber assembly protein [Orbaceae bacterium ESL0727]
MKYQLQPEQAQFDNNGLAIKAGWVLIFNVDSITNEYQDASYEYLPIGVGLPAGAYLDAPKAVDDGKAIVRDGKKWIYLNDYRGQTIYSTETGKESTQNNIGDIPANYTLLAPTSEFDSWDGEKWLLDTAKQHQHEVDIAAQQKNELISEATDKISYLQDAVDADIATSEEVAALANWKKYRVLLNRINVDNAPDITWTEKPE